MENPNSPSSLNYYQPPLIPRPNSSRRHHHHHPAPEVQVIPIPVSAHPSPPPGTKVQISNHNSLGPSFPEIPSPASNSTYYSSANASSGTGFYGPAPPGSAHATRIQNLCATIHTAAPPPPPPQQRMIDDGRGNQLTRHGRGSQREPRKEGRHGHHKRRQSVSVAPPAQVPEVYRFDKDGSIAYKVKSDSAELFVSAPQGSGEAHKFDALARHVASSHPVEHGRGRAFVDGQQHVVRARPQRERPGVMSRILGNSFFRT